MGRVSTEDIVFLEDFLRKRGVLFVDVRQEIVDHVCCSVEDKEGDFKKLSINYLNQHPKLIKNSKGYAFIVDRLFTNKRSQVYKVWGKENVILFLGLVSILFMLLTVLSRYMETLDVFAVGFTMANFGIISLFSIVMLFTFFKRQAYAEPWNHITRMSVMMNVFYWSSLVCIIIDMNTMSLILLASLLSYIILMFRVFQDVLKKMNSKYLI